MSHVVTTATGTSSTKLRPVQRVIDRGPCQQFVPEVCLHSADISLAKHACVLMQHDCLAYNASLVVYRYVWI